MSHEEIALELVKLEKTHRSTTDVRDAFVLYKEYVEKVYQCYKKCNAERYEE